MGKIVVEYHTEEEYPVYHLGEEVTNPEEYYMVTEVDEDFYKLYKEVSKLYDVVQKMLPEIIRKGKIKEE